MDNRIRMKIRELLDGMVERGSMEPEQANELMGVVENGASMSEEEHMRRIDSILWPERDAPRGVA